MKSPKSPAPPPPPVPPVRETSFTQNTIASDARRVQAAKKGIDDTIFAGENPEFGSESSLAKKLLLEVTKAGG